MTQGRPGMIGDARTLASDGLRFVRTRLELLAIEVQREKALAVRQLIVASATFFLVSFGMLLAILALALALPEGQRQVVLGGLGACFLVAGAACAAWLMRKGQRGPLAATVDTLRKDEAMLRAMPDAEIAK
jgi:uncharacterized membrane protein YqjE